MTTTAQDALKVFMDARKTLSLAAIDLAYLLQKEKLEVEAEQEIEANRVASETAQQAQTAQQKSDIINMLQQLGFSCDNSQTDWEKLFNYPEVHGSTWKDKATLQKTLSTGVDYFLSQVQISSVFKPYELNKLYKVSETFTYIGNLYKVNQEHVSQISWTPSSTPALYTQIVPAGVIAEWKQPIGSTDAYKKGDKVLFNGLTYESLIDANVWSPNAYPAGWKLI